MKFVLQRTLAHSELDSHKQWYIKDDCYVCDRCKYTLLVSNTPGTFQGKFKLFDQKAPKLIDVKSFAKQLVETKTKIEENLPKLLELVPHVCETQYLKNELVEKFKENHTDVYLHHKLWYQAIIQKVKFKELQVIHAQNGYQFDLTDYQQSLEDAQDPKLWVYPCYMKPTPGVIKCGQGDHQFLFVPEVRKEPIPPFCLPKFENEEVEEPFDRDKSVFKHWVSDNTSILSNACKADMHYWKVNKFVKDIEEQQKCAEVVKGYFPELKNIFINLISGGDYPHIGRNDFGNFCKDVDILDGTIPISTVDRMFIATKVGARSEGPSHTLFRHEFLEILIRIARAKYIEEMGVCDTYSEALELLLKDAVSKFQFHPWQSFREQSLWNSKVDLIFKANMDTLQRIHENLFPKYGKEGLNQCC